jgi:hypothetical protein
LKAVEVVTSMRQGYVQELPCRDLENVSGAGMPVMLEGALKTLLQIPRAKRIIGTTDGPKSLEGFSLAIGLIATPVNCTQTGRLLQG